MQLKLFRELVVLNGIINKYNEERVWELYSYGGIMVNQNPILQMKFMQHPIDQF